MRYTTFRFALAPTPEQARTLARHCGASRFAFNQSLQLVTDALNARKADPSVQLPWSGFDLINSFNRWKASESAGRRFAVAPDGTTTKQVTGLSWRREVSSQVFEEAAVDLGRGLARYAERSDRRVGFPKFKRKGRGQDSFRVRNKRAPSGRPGIRVGEGHPRSITHCRRSGPFGCMTTPGGCGGCFVRSNDSIRAPVSPSWDRVPPSCPRPSGGELTDGMCA